MSESDVLKPCNAHNSGLTEVCYDTNGNKIVSCGADGKVRIWKNFEEDSVKTIKMGSHVSSVAVCNDTLYVSSDVNTIEKYTFPKGEHDGILARFTGRVTDITVAESKTYVCAGSCDFDIKLINIKTGKLDCFLGHQAPVLSVTVDPQGEFLASSSCDGTLKIWNLKSGKCEKTISIIPSSNDVLNSKSLGKISWRPNTGEDLATPCSEGVKIISRQTWSEKLLFGTETVGSTFQCCCFSPCGRFLASSSKNGWILIWDLDTITSVRKLQHPLKTCVSSIAWNPKQNNSFVFSDTRGQVGVVEGAVPAQPSSDVPTRQEIDDLFDNDDDVMAWDDGDDDDKPTIEQKSPKNEFADECVEGDEDVDLPDIPLTAEVFAGKDNDPELEEATLLPSKVIDDNSNSSFAPASSRNTNQDSVLNMQPAFQSGSTPSYLSNRFMVWNQTGSIRCYNDSDDNAIDIDFHNQGIHHPIHLTNHDAFTMADMSYKAVIFASGESGDKQSKLKCLHFSSWDSNREWSVDMDEGEVIQAITIGESWIATCSDNYQARIFSLGGVQRQIFSIPGPVVCMGGHTDQLIIVYHMGQGFAMNQSLGYMLIELGAESGCKPRNMVSGRPFPISKTSTLTWLGFTVEGTPASCDSKGIVRMMNRSFCDTWITVAELEKLTTKKTHHHWVVGLVENPQQIRSILCKGTTYPPTLPRPMLTVLEYQLPFCEMNNDISKHEEKYWRTKLFSGSNDYLKLRGYETDDRLIDESRKKSSQVLMQLFALLCKSDQDYQAYEVCSMMPSIDAMNLAIKYASRNKKTSLAQRLMEVVQQKAGEEAANEEEEEYEEDRQEEDYKKEIQSGYSKSPTMWKKDGSSQVATSKPPPAINSNGEIKRVNPFKKSTTKLNVVGHAENGGDGTLDGIQRFSTSQKKRTTMSLSSSLKKGKESSIKEKRQAKLNLTSTPKGKRIFPKEEEQKSGSGKMSGVQLYIEENLPAFQGENPDDSLTDVRKIAMQAFRALAPEDKENWNKRAKSGAKRKHDDTENTRATRQKLDVSESQSDFKSKLAQFSAT